MSKITIFIIIGVVGIWIGRMLGKRRAYKLLKSNSGIVGQQAGEKEERKKKILDFLKSNEKITNNDVEKLLSVSDATATRYLDEFEKDGVIKQIGVIGKGVYYVKTKAVQ